METRNINNPAYLSDVSAKIMAKGAFVTSYADLTVAASNVKIKPYIAYLPNGGIISKSTSTMLNISLDFLGEATIVTTGGMERWVTVLMRLSDDGTGMDMIAISGAQAVNAELEKPQRGTHRYMRDNDVVLADVRLYNGMTAILPEDIDLSRAETANYLDPALIPIEVYGPPLNEFNNLDEAIQGINNGALDYRYVKKNGAEYINFNAIDVSDPLLIPNELKREGVMYYAENATERWLSVNLGCHACQVGGEGAAPYPYEGVKKVVLTNPPVGLCTTSCDVQCEAPASDTVACPSCEGSCESHCEGYCQTGCEVSCDAGCEPAAECGDGCQVSCESTCMATCMVYSQT